MTLECGILCGRSLTQASAYIYGGKRNTDFARCEVQASSVQRRACRVVRDDRRHSRGFAELLTEPYAKPRLVDLLNSKAHAG